MSKVSITVNNKLLVKSLALVLSNATIHTESYGKALQEIKIEDNQSFIQQKMQGKRRVY
jgi:hypothetical protein